MQDKIEDEEEKLVDLKGTLETFFEGEEPELSQEEAIKAYKEESNTTLNHKKKKNDSDDDIEDDEHLKRVKQELLETIKKVDMMAKKIFEDKDRDNLKNIKIKADREKLNSRDKIMQQMRENVEKDQERSRGE